MDTPPDFQRPCRRTVRGPASRPHGGAQPLRQAGVAAAGEPIHP